jgi:hypothetical protein
VILVKYKKRYGVGYEVDVNDHLTLRNNEGNFCTIGGGKPPNKCFFLVTLFEDDVDRDAKNNKTVRNRANYALILL